MSICHLYRPSSDVLYMILSYLDAASFGCATLTSKRLNQARTCTSLVLAVVERSRLWPSRSGVPCLVCRAFVSLGVNLYHCSVCRENAVARGELPPLTAAAHISARHL